MTAVAPSYGLCLIHGGPWIKRRRISAGRREGCDLALSHAGIAAKIGAGQQGPPAGGDWHLAVGSGASVDGGTRAIDAMTMGDARWCR